MTKEDLEKMGVVITFPTKIELDDVYGEVISIIPNSEYRVKPNTKKGYEGWVILSGIWYGEQSVFGGAFSFSPKQYTELLKNVSKQ
jgi:hypothetical protein